MPSSTSSFDPFDSIRYIPYSYEYTDSHESALNLILALRPEWRASKSTIEFVRFTDGITNTLLKAINKLPGLSEAGVDEEAILLRAYGKGTDVLIDRRKEASSHCLLARYGLAPQLLARFDNGLLYKYIQGSVCAPADLRRPEIWRGVAQRLGQWHATLPVSSASSPCPQPSQIASIPNANKRASLVAMAELTAGKPVPNVWTTMQKWIQALPTSTTAQLDRRDLLQRELVWLVSYLGNKPGVDSSSFPPNNSNLFVFAHCDLLSGNVIISPTPPAHSAPASRRSSLSSIEPCSSSEDASFEPPDHLSSAAPVYFIDYEYATPAPAAFDLANHFAEWGGFDCDHSVLPTQSVRRAFLADYLRSYNLHVPSSGKPSHDSSTTTTMAPSSSDLEILFAQVDLFRGVPGFYWGIWALIQAQISLIDFDYGNYAEVRLDEYWGWKRAVFGTAAAAGANEVGPEETSTLSVREKRWRMK